VGTIVGIAVSVGVCVIVGVEVEVALGVGETVAVGGIGVCVGGIAVGAIVGKLVGVGISAVGNGVAVGRGVRVGNDVGVDGLDPKSGVFVGVGEIIAGKVGGVIIASSRGAIESK
jgi:hypothetical protein